MIHQRQALAGLIEIESHAPRKELTLRVMFDDEWVQFPLRADQAAQFVSMAREAKDRPGPAEPREDRYAGRVPLAVFADGSKAYAKDPVDDPAPTLDPQA